ncbi:MAG: MBL fold metallo-hydrolase [Oscillospiraceae bacterium]|nr:MBL fold metallo-hydrolase [Oscillospiraceae bacterium]
MQIKLLGTGAHEGLPGLFCQCDNCNFARVHGGKNIRMRSGTLIDTDIWIDFSPDAYMQATLHGVDMAAVKHLLVTHSHGDHFSPCDLDLRRPPYGHFGQREPLRVYGNQAVEEKYRYMFAEPSSRRMFSKDADVLKEYIEIIKIVPFDIFALDECTTVTALPAAHDRNEECLVYLIERDKKVMMYGHDSGIYPEETWAALQGKRIDLITLDCTFGPGGEGSNHMGLLDNIVVRDRMLAEGIAGEKTQFVITHFSHNGGQNHAQMEKLATKHGMLCGYDGAIFDL